MNKRELEAENDALREALMDVYNSIESALADLDQPAVDDDELKDSDDDD